MSIDHEIEEYEAIYMEILVEINNESIYEFIIDNMETDLSNFTPPRNAYKTLALANHISNLNRELFQSFLKFDSELMSYRFNLIDTRW